MKAFLEIKKIELEDIITASNDDGGLTNGGSGNAGSGSGSSSGWGDPQATSLLD